jgi:hypothetical protein
MKVQLVTLTPAHLERRLAIKDAAWGIAQAAGITPADSRDAICQEFKFLCQVGEQAHKNEGDQVLLVNGQYAEVVHPVDARYGDPSRGIIGPMLTRNAVDAWGENEQLHIQYVDGLVERYSQHPCGAWVYEDNNPGVNAPGESRGVN